MKLLGAVLVLQVSLGLALVILVATDNLPFTDGDADGAPPPRPAVNRFDGAAAFGLLRGQVELGPRPAGSKVSRRSETVCATFSRVGASRRCRADCGT